MFCLFWLFFLGGGSHQPGVFLRIYNLRAIAGSSTVPGLTRSQLQVDHLAFHLHGGTSYGRGIGILPDNSPDVQELKRYGERWEKNVVCSSAAAEGWSSGFRSGVRWWLTKTDLHHLIVTVWVVCRDMAWEHCGERSRKRQLASCMNWNCKAFVNKHLRALQVCVSGVLLSQQHWTIWRKMHLSVTHNCAPTLFY